MGNKIQKIFLFSLLGLIATNLFGQENDTISGKLFWNLDFTKFDGFYGMDDSMVEMYKDTIEKYYLIAKDKRPVKANSFKRKYEKGYEILEQANLLYSPCEYIVTSEGKDLRIYFSEKDYQEILDSEWFPDMKRYNLETHITVFVNKITGDTFLCKELISIKKRKLERN